MLPSLVHLNDECHTDCGWGVNVKWPCGVLVYREQEQGGADAVAIITSTADLDNKAHALRGVAGTRYEVDAQKLKNAFQEAQEDDGVAITRKTFRMYAYKPFVGVDATIRALGKRKCKEGPDLKKKLDTVRAKMGNEWTLVAFES